MIEMYFRRGAYLAPLLSTPAWPHLDELATELHRQGFRRWILRGRLVGAAHFSLWNEEKLRKPLHQLHEDALQGFRHHLRECCCPRLFKHSRHWDARAVAGALALVHLLRRKLVISSLPPSPPVEEQPTLVRGFIKWMRQGRGTTAKTLRGYSRVIREALDALGNTPSRYTAKSLRVFVLKQSMRAGCRYRGKETMTAMRAFLRYLIAKGVCRPGMDDAIPTIAHWRLAALPRYLPAADVDRILNSCDERTPLGLRDHAVLLLLARLGLREGDIRDMRLSDLDWQQGAVRVSGKGRVEVRLPLTQEVGDGILRYLQRGRPPAQTDRLFVRMAAPWGSLGTGTVSSLVARAMDRAGIVSKSRGAHVLRHSAATQMLRQGATLQEIAVVLRHRYLDTTAHYAKVDVQRLRAIALPWPEVTPC